MKNIILIFLLITSNVSAQKDSLLKGKAINTNIDTTRFVKIGSKKSSLPPLIILDGLKISQDTVIRFNLFKLGCIRKIKVINDYEFDTTNKYSGAVKIYTKILFVLNDSLLKRKREKITALSKIKQEEIKSIKKINPEKAMKKYGKAGKHGAIIIKTK